MYHRRWFTIIDAKSVLWSIIEVLCCWLVAWY